MPSPIRRLPDAELAVMQALWACETPAARADIAARLAPMAPTTLLTLLTRLEKRGFVRIEKVGRVSRYFPRIAQQEYLAARSRSFFETLCGGSMSTFAAALCDSGLSREELSELRALLEQDAL